MRPSVGLGGVKPPVSHDTHVLLWTALVGALTVFLKQARKALDMPAGETCPRCNHRF